VRLGTAAWTADSEEREGRGIWWFAVGIWAALIFAGSSIPSAHWAGGVNLRDAVLHAAEYAVLAALLRRAGLSWGASLAAAAAYAAGDEFHQSFVHNRDASASDLFFDVVGATIGASVPRTGDRSASE
jgi:hypothetical protein